MADQFAGNRLRRRLGLALANHHAFAIENANMRNDSAYNSGRDPAIRSLHKGSFKFRGA